jgi:hypothetical protein
MGTQRKDRCSGVRRPSEVVAGNRGGPIWPLEVPGQGRGRPRPVGISDQARSVTGRRVQVPAMGGRLGSGPPSSPSPARGCGTCGPARPGCGQSGRPRRWGAGARRPGRREPWPHGDRLPAAQLLAVDLPDPRPPARSRRGRPVPRAPVRNSRMAEAAASSRARSSSVPSAALLWPERVTPVSAPRPRSSRSMVARRPHRWWRTHPPGGAAGGRPPCGRRAEMGIVGQHPQDAVCIPEGDHGGHGHHPAAGVLPGHLVV